MSVIQTQKGRFVEPENLPPKPTYVFRGHVAEITALQFIRRNTRLVSGYPTLAIQTFLMHRDSDGWTVVWDMTSRRPATVWKAHDASLLTIRAWGCDKLITYRDEKRKR